MVATAENTNADCPLVEVRNLHVKFGQQAVLRDVSLSVRRGETLAVIGESGCGKTVLLKSIIGLIRPTHGEVFFDGENLAGLTERELATRRARMGYVFQQAALFDSMTIGQNIAFPLKQHSKLDDRDIQDVVLARLAEVGLPSSVLRKRPAELSGGMRKRVGLARALVANPELLLYDEPTTGLDPIVADVINELMMRARDHHQVTSIVVTHDMRTAMKTADRVVMVYPLSRLGGGEPQVIFDGNAEELQQSELPRVRQFVRGEAGQRLLEMGVGQGA
jgi:phospholipid/cholesterol/gamma-HCH transport system ATP-binding protein